jgi:transposase-like protein
MRQGQPRDPRKEQFWRGHMARWQRSGLSVPAYCARHDLTPANFYAWRRTLAQRDRQRPAPAPTPVTLVPISLPTPSAADDALIEVVLRNGRRLRLAPTVALSVVRNLVALLEEATC